MDKKKVNDAMLAIQCIINEHVFNQTIDREVMRDINLILINLDCLINNKQEGYEPVLEECIQEILRNNKDTVIDITYF